MDGSSENTVAGPASGPPSDKGLERLEALLDQLAQDLGGLGPPEFDGTGHLDPGLVAGPSPQAQENRAIHISRARLAADRAREARERLPGLVSQVQEGLAQIRSRHGRPQAAGEEISRALKAAMSEVTPAEDPDGSLRGVVRGAVAGIPSVDAATVALRDNQARLLRAIGSDAIAEALTDHQTATREGPCLEVARTGSVVECSDLAAGDAPWPVFTPLALGLGVRSVIVMPLRTTYPTGSLSLWSLRPHAFDETTHVLGDLFVEHASLAVQNAERYRRLEQALHTRDLIGQAKGIVMVRRGLGPDEAFRLLVSSSQETNVKLVEVARWVVENLASPGSA